MFEETSGKNAQIPMSPAHRGVPFASIMPGFAQPVRPVDVNRPWLWLMAGWTDLCAAPRESLAFGAMIALVSAGLVLGLWQADFLPYVFPLAAGFMFIAPLAAIAFYEISRRRERGDIIGFWSVAFAWRRYPGQIFFLGLVLMFLHLLWERAALLLYALFFGIAPVQIEDFLHQILFTSQGLAFLAVGIATGAVLAVMTFAITLTACPMVLDQDCGILRAIVTSIDATRMNWRVLSGWAALIVLFTGAGIVTGCLGLIIAMPLIGHASWHAYRDLVAPPPSPGAA